MAQIITNVGKAFVVSKLRGSDTTNFPQFIGWGTGSGTAAAGDTDLFTPAAEARVSGTMTAQTTSTTGDSFQVAGTLTSASTQNITNAGVFTASTGGTLVFKADFSSVPMVSGDSIAFTFKDVQS